MFIHGRGSCRRWSSWQHIGCSGDGSCTIHSRGSLNGVFTLLLCTKYFVRTEVAQYISYPRRGCCGSIQTSGYFYGPGILVAPVTNEKSTTTDIYLPDDIFYDFYTHEAMRGSGDWTTLTDVAYTTIPLYYKGGSIVALRANSANTRTELRKQNISVVVAPGLNGTATGNLYLDDGVSIEQASTSYITFTYDTAGRFAMAGSFDYNAGYQLRA